MLNDIAIISDSTDNNKIINPIKNIKENLPATKVLPKAAKDLPKAAKDLPKTAIAHPIKEHILPVQNVSVNVVNQTNYNEILVKYDNVGNKFIIYDKNKILLGTVSIIQFIKYITTNISKNFLKLNDHESSIDVIEKYFCKYNKETNKIVLLSYLESPIMGSLEMVLKLYSGIDNFETNNLKIEMNKSNEDPEVLNAIQNKIKEVVYLILNHALKLIVNISEAIKNDSSKNEMKSTLTKYSIFIINKINHYIKEGIDTKVYECKNLEIQIVQLEKIKSETHKKLLSLEETIKIQNEKINKILDYMDINDFDAILEKPVASPVPSENTDSDTDTDTNTGTDSINAKESNMDDRMQNIENIINGVNANFKDSDYSYSESDEKKTDIKYLTPKE